MNRTRIQTGGRARARRWWLAGLVLALVVGGPATQASAKKSKRYGIEATLISYDKERQVVRAKVMSNKVRGFGGSNA
ncbi:MAG: hypothetical protein MJE66_13780, partial [Proteobacteria bacterium]|nr:hypothetical protein [Pseudomonadota bacterium]